MLTIAVAAAASAGCAAILHAAGSRADAAAIVPLAQLWGVAVAMTAWRAGPIPAGWVIAAAVLVRAPLVGTPWLLSDDAWRYLWEGAALTAGHNPFAQAPAAIHGLDDALRARVNHPEIPSIYPPLALVWFVVLHLAGGTPVVAQLASGAADCAVVLGILRLCELRDAPTWPALLYALHPLAALESAASAHLEAPALACALAGLLAWQRRRDDLAWIGLGAAALVKVLPVVALPAMASRWSDRSTRGLLAIAAIGTVAAMPVVGAGAGLLTALGNYARHWSFNGMLFPWLTPWLGDWTRLVLIAGAGAFVVRSLRRGDPATALGAAGAAFVLTTPTAHPWYALWALVPSLALGRRGWAWASIALIGAYGVLTTWDPVTASWSEPSWLWWATWPPALAALLAGAIADRSEAPPTRP